MDRITGAVIAFLLATNPADASPAFNGTTTIPPDTVEVLFGFQLGAWNDACEAMKADCRKIIPPQVGYALLFQQYGKYDLTDRTLLVDVRLIGQPMSYLVMVHEMVHYIQSVRDGARKVTQAQACLDEQQAHDISYALKLRLKIDDPRVKQWSEIAEFVYGCPAPEAAK